MLDNIVKKKTTKTKRRRTKTRRVLKKIALLDKY